MQKAPLPGMASWFASKEGLSISALRERIPLFEINEAPKPGLIEMQVLFLVYLPDIFLLALFVSPNKGIKRIGRGVGTKL